MAEHDLVIRGGTVADGLGGELIEADVAVKDGRIVAVGPKLGSGTEELDARGLLVTPGFVDIHTHYDGQATWESRMVPSSDHGVTSIVMGSCGVGFAPCRPEDRDELISLMVGVEDIPEVVMAEGLPWTWESVPQYLDAIAALPHDVDIASMIPHSALRVFAMGERAIQREDATEADIAYMAQLTREAMRAGSIGFATSRSLQHKTSKGAPIPTLGAAEAELRGILNAMAETGSGVFQALSDFDLFKDVEGEFAMFRRLVGESGRPMSFTVNQKHRDPDRWRELMKLTGEASDAGLPIRAQVLGRPTGLLLGIDLTMSPFSGCPTYDALAILPFADRLAAMRTSEVRAKILEETTTHRPPASWRYMFEMGDPPNYEPEESESLAARAQREGKRAAELAYDVVLADDGRGLVSAPAQNFAAFSLDPSYEMMTHKDAILGLGDGGAHCGFVCDASYPTTMLSYWARDRTRGPRLDLAQAVKALTSSTADAFGLRDRGRIAIGYKADLNLIDHDRLTLRRPQVTHDLPSGGRRIVQRAQGYKATIVGGETTYRDGQSTGKLPGRLVRGAQKLQ